MGELTPVDPTDLSDREVAIAALRGVQQTHSCLETHILETKMARLDATEKRLQLAEDVIGARTDIAAIQADVREMALALRVKKPQVGEAKPKAQAEVSLIGLLKIFGAAAGAFGFFLIVYQLLRVTWPSLALWLTSIDGWLMSLSPN